MLCTFAVRPTVHVAGGGVRGAVLVEGWVEWNGGLWLWLWTTDDMATV